MNLSELLEKLARCKMYFQGTREEKINKILKLFLRIIGVPAHKSQFVYKDTGKNVPMAILILFSAGAILIRISSFSFIFLGLIFSTAATLVRKEGNTAVLFGHGATWTVNYWLYFFTFKLPLILALTLFPIACIGALYQFYYIEEIKENDEKNRNNK